MDKRAGLPAFIPNSLFGIVIREKIGYTCTDKSKLEQDIKERG